MQNQRPYIEEATNLVANASVAVQVLLNSTGDDMEFVPAAPQPANAEYWADLRTRWHGRGLHSIGFLAMVDGQAKAVFKESVTLDVVGRLASAFQAYCESLAFSEAKEQMTEYDWQNRRYHTPYTHPPLMC